MSAPIASALWRRAGERSAATIGPTPRSLSATAGALIGPDYHFDLVRPGIGLYGGLPFAAGCEGS